MKTLQLFNTLGLCIAMILNGNVQAQMQQSTSSLPAEEAVDNASRLQDMAEMKVARIAELATHLKASENPEPIKHEIEVLQAELSEVLAQIQHSRKEKAGRAAATEGVVKFEFNPERADLKLTDFDYRYEPMTGLLHVQFRTKSSGKAEVRVLTPGSVVVDQAEACGSNEVSISLDVSKSPLDLFFINIALDGKMVTKKVQLS